MKSLLLGCGNSREMKLKFNGARDFGELTTLDMNPDCGADVVLEIEGGWYPGKLPFPPESFDHVAAYDCLEHWGRQGDWRGWFDEMGEYHRILKPGGTMGILVPIGEDAVADPGHTRFFSENNFAFLMQGFYDMALEDGRPVTDYRWYWKKSFDVLYMERQESHHLAVILRRPA